MRQFNKDKLIIAYKLLHDILFIVLLFFLLALISESVLPGVIISHVDFTIVTVFIFLVITAIYILGNFLHTRFTKNETSKKTAFILLFLFIALIFNSLLKINILLNIIILLFIIAAGYFTYQALMEKN